MHHQLKQACHGITQKHLSEEDQGHQKNYPALDAQLNLLSTVLQKLSQRVWPQVGSLVMLLRQRDLVRRHQPLDLLSM
jgi:hypothetical protein